MTSSSTILRNVYKNEQKPCRYHFSNIAYISWKTTNATLKPLKSSNLEVNSFNGSRIFTPPLTKLAFIEGKSIYQKAEKIVNDYKMFKASHRRFQLLKIVHIVLHKCVMIPQHFSPISKNMFQQNRILTIQKVMKRFRAACHKCEKSLIADCQTTYATKASQTQACAVDVHKQLGNSI